MRRRLTICSNGWNGRYNTQGEPSEVAVVLRGLKGTGKGILARVLLDIFATHGLHISKADHLTGRFNAYVVLDEAIWPSDKAGEGFKAHRDRADADHRAERHRRRQGGQSFIDHDGVEQGLGLPGFHP